MPFAQNLTVRAFTEPHIKHGTAQTPLTFKHLYIYQYDGDSLTTLMVIFPFRPNITVTHMNKKYYSGECGERRKRAIVKISGRRKQLIFGPPTSRRIEDEGERKIKGQILRGGDGIRDGEDSKMRQSALPRFGMLRQ